MKNPFLMERTDYLSFLHEKNDFTSSQENIYTTQMGFIGEYSNNS